VRRLAREVHPAPFRTMIRLVLSQLRFRPGRAAALGVSLVVSSVAFVLLLGSAQSGELKVKGSVRSTFRPAYDVLVRPRGSKSALERSQGLVRDNYLSGIFGGITLKQWREIENLGGVAVAAPIANVGYTAAFAKVPLSVDSYLTNAPVQLLRLQTSYVTPDGSRYPAATSYIYITRAGRFTKDKTATGGPPAGELDHGESIDPCGGFAQPVSTQSFQSELFPSISCFSMRSGRPELLGSSNHALEHVQSEIGGSFPVFLAAIDPTQEAKLLRVDQTVVSGRYLRPSERPTTAKHLDPLTHQTVGYRYVPVLAASKTYIGDRLQTQIDRLTVPKGVDVAGALAAGSCRVAYIPCPASDLVRAPRGSRFETGLSFVRSLTTAPVGTDESGFNALYQELLAGFATDQRQAIAADSYWAISDVQYRRSGGGALVPKVVSNPPSVYASAFNTVLPWDNRDVQFRHLAVRQGDNAFVDGILNRPFLRVVGQFDPTKLPGFSPLSRVPLETYYPPLLTPANAQARAVLHGKSLSPTQNLGDYIQQPPLLLTTVASLPALLNTNYFHGVPAKQRLAPISAIRVRVAGVTGADATSIARIDSVALRIHELTGLDVDITAGSSPHPLTLALPAGRFGRPPLNLIEGWSKKGVSVSFLRGVDRKQIALFAMIPLLCCLFLGNGVVAAARSRRSEIGALMTLGWDRAPIFRLLLSEILFVGLAAGVVGMGTAYGVSLLLGLHPTLLSILIVFPTALGMALLAGLLPSWSATKDTPLDALRPPVVGSGHGGRVDHLAALAIVNLRRIPGRAFLGGLGLVVGACALTVLIAVEQAFNGVLAGSVLGDAISVQVRGFDYLAVGFVIGLAALSVADVLYLNLRERQAELVTLRTLGWQQHHLAKVVLIEALTIGILASAAGVLSGFLIGWIVLAAPVLPVLEGGVAALGGGILAAAFASLLPLSQIGRLTPPSVLAAEQ
jgi:putative ABC transport system permease protein